MLAMGGRALSQWLVDTTGYNPVSFQHQENATAAATAAPGGLGLVARFALAGAKRAEAVAAGCCLRNQACETLQWRMSRLALP
jgi:hypothetical protein